MTSPGRPRDLVFTAIAGQLVAYVLAILLARRLGVDGFEAYVVASAVFILLATLAPLGAEKYALRQLPALLARADWGLARGFLNFGVRRTLAMALASGLAAALWTAFDPARDAATRAAILVTCLSLPAGALVHYGVEVLTAAGQPHRALVIFRLVVPALALLFALLLFALRADVSGAMAVGCWGLAWAVALALMWASFRTHVPAPIFAAAPIEAGAAWRAAAWPFFIYRMALSLLSQAGILAIGLLGPPLGHNGAIGAYAAAMSTAGMVAVLATATNRAYGRDLALALERRDYAAVLSVRRARLRWMLPIVALFLLAAFLFSGQILALFRPEFVAEGVMPLRLHAVSTAFTVLFALAPTYLKFRKRNRATYSVVAGAAVVQLLLLLLLVPRFGATGAALAHMVSMCGMYGSFALLAHREVMALKAAAA